MMLTFTALSRYSARAIWVLRGSSHRVAVSVHHFNRFITDLVRLFPNIWPFALFRRRDLMSLSKCLLEPGGRARASTCSQLRAPQVQVQAILTSLTPVAARLSRTSVEKTQISSILSLFSGDELRNPAENRMFVLSTCLRWL